MTRGVLKKLVLGCYKDNALDSTTVLKIANLLSPKDLKQFIKLLKSEETKHTVQVSTAVKLSSDEEKDLKSLYKNKLVSFTEDPSLLTGIRIQDADMIYENSLASNLTTIKAQITKL